MNAGKQQDRRGSSRGGLPPVGSLSLIKKPTVPPLIPCSPRRRLLYARSFDGAIEGTLEKDMPSFVHLKLMKHVLWYLLGIYGDDPPRFATPKSADLWWERLRLVKAAALALFHDHAAREPAPPPPPRGDPDPDAPAAAAAAAEPLGGRRRRSTMGGRPALAVPVLERALRAHAAARAALAPQVGARVLFCRAGRWLPAAVAEHLGQGRLKLQFEGTEAFDRLMVHSSDPRMKLETYFNKEDYNRSLYLKNTYAKHGQRVRLAVVDCLEEEFYGAYLRTRPVGTVVDVHPSKDLAEVDLVKPCGVERVFTRNPNLTIITEEEFQQERQQMQILRTQVVQWVRRALVLETPFALGALGRRLRGQSAPLSFSVHRRGLHVAALDVLAGRILKAAVPEGLLLGLLEGVSLANYVNCSPQFRLGLCERVAAHLRVEKGILKFVPQSQNNDPSSEREEPLMETLHTVKRVHIKVSFLRKGQQMNIQVRPNQKGVENVPVYNFWFDPQDWSFLEFGRFDWLSDADIENLCKNLLSFILLKDGYPVLKLPKREIMCEEFLPFKETKEEVDDRPAWEKGKPKGWKKFKTFFNANMMRVKSKKNLPFRKLVASIKDPGMHRHNFFVTVRIVDDSESGYKAGQDPGLAMQFVGARVAVRHIFRSSDWYKYGYGPLNWMSKDQKDRMIDMICHWICINPSTGEWSLEEEIIRQDFSKRELMLQQFSSRRLVRIFDQGTHFKIMATAKGVPGDWELGGVGAAAWGARTGLGPPLWLPVRARLGLAARLAHQVVVEEAPPQAYVDCNIPVPFWKAGANIKGRSTVVAYDLGLHIIIDIRALRGEHIALRTVSRRDWDSEMGKALRPFLWVGGCIRDCMGKHREPLATSIKKLAKVGHHSLSEAFIRKRVQDKLWDREFGEAPPDYPIFTVSFEMPPPEDPTERRRKRFAMMRQMSARAANMEKTNRRINMAGEKEEDGEVFPVGAFSDIWGDDALLTGAGSEDGFDDLAEDLRCLCCGQEGGESHGMVCSHKLRKCKPCKISEDVLQRKAITDALLEKLQMEQDEEEKERQIMKWEDYFSAMHGYEIKNELLERVSMEQEDASSKCNEIIANLFNQFGSHLLKEQPDVQTPFEVMIRCSKIFLEEQERPDDQKEPLSTQQIETLFMALEDKASVIDLSSDPEEEVDVLCNFCEKSIDLDDPFTEGWFGCATCEAAGSPPYDLCAPCARLLARGRSLERTAAAAGGHKTLLFLRHHPANHALVPLRAAKDRPSAASGAARVPPLPLGAIFSGLALAKGVGRRFSVTGASSSSVPLPRAWNAPLQPREPAAAAEGRRGTPFSSIRTGSLDEEARDRAVSLPDFVVSDEEGVQGKAGGVRDGRVVVTKPWNQSEGKRGSIIRRLKKISFPLPLLPPATAPKSLSQNKQKEEATEDKNSVQSSSLNPDLAVPPSLPLAPVN